MSRSFDCLVDPRSLSSRYMPRSAERGYWLARLAATGSTAELDSFDVDANGCVRVRIVQDVRNSVLPRPFGKLYPRGLEVAQGQTWTLDGGARVRGEVLTEARGALGSGLSMFVMAPAHDGDRSSAREPRLQGPAHRWPTRELLRSPDGRSNPRAAALHHEVDRKSTPDALHPAVGAGSCSGFIERRPWVVSHGTLAQARRPTAVTLSFACEPVAQTRCPGTTQCLPTTKAAAPPSQARLQSSETAAVVRRCKCDSELLTSAAWLLRREDARRGLPRGCSRQHASDQLSATARSRCAG